MLHYSWVNFNMWFRNKLVTDARMLRPPNGTAVACGPAGSRYAGLSISWVLWRLRSALAPYEPRRPFLQERPRRLAVVLGLSGTPVGPRLSQQDVV